MDVMVEMTHDEVQNNLCYALFVRRWKALAGTAVVVAGCTARRLPAANSSVFLTSNLPPTSGIWYPAYLTRFA